MRRRLDLLPLPPPVEHLLEGAPGFLEHGSRSRGEVELRQVADRLPLGSRDESRVGALDAGEDLQEGRLPGPVAPDESNPISVADEPVDVVEEDLPPERFAQFLDAQHD